MAIPRFYESSDASAPSITGQNGSLITVLDAVLVDGYGSKAAAGWTKLFSGTNQAVYQSATGRVMHVLDDGSRIDARGASIRGAESATGATPADLLNAHPPNDEVVWTKSSTADSTTRAWKIAATPTQILWIGSSHQNTSFAGNPDMWVPGFFGELINSIAGDSNAWIVLGHTSATFSNIQPPHMIDQIRTSFTSSSTGPDEGMAASSDGLSTAIDVGLIFLCPEGETGTATFPDLAGFTEYPSKSQGGMGLTPIYVYEKTPGYNLRGQVPGFYLPLQKISLAGSQMPADAGVSFQGDFGYGTRSYMWLPVMDRFETSSSTASLNGSFVLDISSDWAAP